MGSFNVWQLVYIVAVLIVGLVGIKMLMKVIERVAGKIKIDEGPKVFALKLVNVALYIGLGLIVANMTGIDTSSIVTLVSVISLALSLAFQDLISNLICGGIVLVSKPFKVGDYVDVCGVSGTVQSVSLMRTVLSTPDNKIQSVPNMDISKSLIVNYSESDDRRFEIKVNVDFESDMDVVFDALHKVLKETNGVMLEVKGKEPQVTISGYNDFGIEVMIRAWVPNEVYWDGYFKVMNDISSAFKANGIKFAKKIIVQ